MTKCTSSQMRLTGRKNQLNFAEEPNDDVTMNLENMFNSGFTSLDMMSRQSLYDNKLKTNNSGRIQSTFKVHVNDKTLTQKKENPRPLFSPQTDMNAYKSNGAMSSSNFSSSKETMRLR